MYRVQQLRRSKEAFEMVLLWMKLPPAQRLALRKVVEELCYGE